MKAIADKPFKPAFMVKQPEVSHLVRELRQLMQFTQVQLAAELGVVYETINRWENNRMQPSPLALKQIYAVLDRLNQSSSKFLRDGSVVLLSKYFGENL